MRTFSTNYESNTNLRIIARKVCSYIRKSFVVRRDNGFTLIEMLVVTAIIATLSGIIIANFRQGERRTAVRESAELVASSLRQMQNNTLSGLPTASGVPGIGYSVEFLSASPTSYSTYVHLQAAMPTRQILEQLKLVDGVEIRDPRINLGGFFVILDRLELRFVPPFAKIYYASSPWPGADSVICFGLNFSDVNIDVVDTVSGFFKTIVINCVSGRIEVQ